MGAGGARGMRIWGRGGPSPTVPPPPPRGRMCEGGLWGRTGPRCDRSSQTARDAGWGGGCVKKEANGPAVAADRHTTARTHACYRRDTQSRNICVLGVFFAPFFSSVFPPALSPAHTHHAPPPATTCNQPALYSASSGTPAPVRPLVHRSLVDRYTGQLSTEAGQPPGVAAGHALGVAADLSRT